MKKTKIALVAIATVIGVGMLAPVDIVAAKDEVESAKFQEGDGCTKNFLGLRPWYYGLKKGSGCTVGTPTEEEMPVFIWTIVLNILADLFGVLGFLAIGFVIYGGILFIKSEGDPGKVAKGKKTLTYAAIGIGIALLASVIVNTIIGVLIAAT